MTESTTIPALTDEQKRRVASSAIKGYLYQFVESLILALENETTRVEGIEDIDVLNSTKIQAVQVKYYESSTWSLCSIRDAIIPMLKSYKNNPELTFSLFIHVKQSTSQPIPTTLTEEDLKKCLTIHPRDKITKKRISKPLYCDSDKESLLSGFASHFHIKNAVALEDLEKQAVMKLCSTLNCPESEAKIIHLMRGVGYIEKVASKNDSAKRIIKRDELIDFLNIKDIIYNEWHKQVIGSKRFEQEIIRKLRELGYGKQQLRKTLYVSFKNNDTTTIAKIAELLSRSITDPEAKRLKTAQPWTIILDCEEQDVINIVKRKLLEKDIEFNDGYENIQFNPKLFGSTPFTETKGRRPVLSRISFSLRIIEASSVRKMYKETATSSCQDFDFGKVLAFQTVPDDLLKIFGTNQLVQIEKINLSSIDELLGRIIG